ncbi:hypothetical protein EDB19DRAFT_893199 [Suillus lakei]|nr:hypothetical protein EDB19DRAFT_893199 [Suillus lakei]
MTRFRMDSTAAALHRTQVGVPATGKWIYGGDDTEFYYLYGRVEAQATRKDQLHSILQELVIGMLDSRETMTRRNGAK